MTEILLYKTANQEVLIEHELDINAVVAKNATTTTAQCSVGYKRNKHYAFKKYLEIYSSS